MFSEIGATSDALSVVVIDTDPRLRTRLAMQLGDSTQASFFPNIEEAQAVLFNNVPTVLVLGPSFSATQELANVSTILRSHTQIEAVLVVEDLSTTVLQQAMRAGIADVIPVPAEGGQLLEAIHRASRNLPVPTVTKPVDPDSVGTDRARVITVFSTKGGAGKSVVAANLAVIMARHTDKPVVLLDADLQFGDMAVMLKLSPQHTIVDAVHNIDRLDVSLLKSLLIKHEASGVFVLPAPTEPAFADQVSAATMIKITELLKDFAGYIVIDTPSHFNEVVLGLIEASDEIVLVAGMDIPNIKNVKIGLQVLRLLEVPVSKLKLVLNRSNSKVKLDISEVERTLQLKADCLVPSDMIVPQSVNKGVPVVLDSPKSGVSRSLEQLGALLATAAESARAKR